MEPAFQPLATELRHIDELPVPWFVAGGWAIDLFLGRVTRDHQDVDLAVARSDQRAVYEHITDRTWSKIVPHPEGHPWEGTIEPWDGTLLSLPTYQVLADADDHRIEFQLGEIGPLVWRSRRNPEVSMPMCTMALTTDDGVPYLTPEIVLFDKAVNVREWDELDFENALPDLYLGHRHWLYHALEQEQPGHPWMPQLGVS